MSEYGVITAPRTVRLERTLPGPIEKVWAYLTESDKRGEWLAIGEMDLRVGGAVELVFDNSNLTPGDEKPPAKYAEMACGKQTLSGRITKLDPPRLLAYTWPQGGEELSEVTFELTPQGRDVLLVITHKNLADRNVMLSVSAGWHAHVGIMIDRLNGRAPQPFWSTHTRLEQEYDVRIPQ